MRSRDSTLKALRELSAKQFLSDFILDETPHVFRGDRRSYAGWRGKLAERLEVDASCLTLVGSSAIGLSLNPAKNFREFDDASDIDVAVISSFYFNMSWRYLRNNGHRRLYLPLQTRTAWEAHVNKYIYWGTIATDKLLGVLPFGQKWLQAASFISQVDPSKNKEVKFRLYLDHESLRAYQLNSVKLARDALLEADA